MHSVTEKVSKHFTKKLWCTQSFLYVTPQFFFQKKYK